MLIGWKKKKKKLIIALVIGTNQKGTFHKTKLYNPKSPPESKQAGFLHLKQNY